MKTHEDLARGLWLKGKSDLANAQMCLDAGLALDTACFHAQQAGREMPQSSSDTEQNGFSIHA